MACEETLDVAISKLIESKHHLDQAYHFINEPPRLGWETRTKDLQEELSELIKDINDSLRKSCTFCDTPAKWSVIAAGQQEFVPPKLSCAHHRQETLETYKNNDQCIISPYRNY